MPNDRDRTAIDTERAWRLLIGGEWVDPGAGTYPVVDPNDGTVVGHAPEATAGQADDAARAAREALPGWRALSPAERGGRLARLADVIERMAPSWLDLVQAETGSVTSIAKSLQVGGPMIERFRYYSNPINVDEDIAPMPADKGALGPAGLIAATVKRQPVGVVACITPYNMPLVNVAGKVAPALAAGNTVVIKPAPQDPLGVLLLGEAVAEAGLGDGVVNIVTGSGPEAPAALVASNDVNMVSFTGSTQVGARIYADGASTMKRVLMELGGKGALGDDRGRRRERGLHGDRHHLGTPLGPDLHRADPGDLPSQHPRPDRGDAEGLRRLHEGGRRPCARHHRRPGHHRGPP